MRQRSPLSHGEAFSKRSSWLTPYRLADALFSVINVPRIAAA
jgi:hypothetical protein